MTRLVVVVQEAKAGATHTETLVALYIRASGHQQAASPARPGRMLEQKSQIYPSHPRQVSQNSQLAWTMYV